jgi:tetratricopeptide (TPR) repeat protein
MQRSLQTMERLVAEGAVPGGLKDLPLPELFARAQQAYQAKEWASAQALLLVVLERDPLWAAAWLRLGNALQQVSDTTSAMRAYRRCVEVSNSGDRSHGQKALANIASLQLERFDEALAELERWGGSEPSTGPALVQAADAAKQRLLLARAQSETLLAATTQERVPVYQGWSARRQPGKRQLALPPEDRPADKPASSKPVLRATTGVRPALPKVQTQEELQEATPEVIYLKGGDAGVGGVKPAETRPK